MLNPADQGFIDTLTAEVGASLLRPPSEHYLTEPRGKFQGIAGCIVAPRSTEEVAKIVRLCAAHNVGIVPFGGGTGLVCGQVKPDGPAPVVLSLEKLSAIREVSNTENTLVAEAGVTLSAIHEAARNAHRLFPLALASEGSCTAGGFLSTNAGGSYTLRYGNARALCLGLEAVLPNGEIWHGLTPLRKDNMGYDLRDLLIGAEGTLGIITAASLRLFPAPRKSAVALLAVPDPQGALDLLNMAQDTLGEVVSAYELMHRQGFDFLSEALPHLRTPFDTPPEWTILIDIGAPEALDLDTKFSQFLDHAISSSLVLDGWIAQSDKQASEFWNLRESIPVANRAIGAISSHDISLPLSKLPEFIERAETVVNKLGQFRINCFGHAGDGNLHYNVYPPKGGNKADYQNQAPAIMQAIHDLVHEMAGSISAEHGIGRLKADDLEKYGDPAKLAAMRAIKSALDPLGIMNPGAVLK